MFHPNRDIIDPSWRPALELHRTTLAAIDARLAEESQHGITHAPQPANVFRALTMPLESVRVLLIGQDPYPTPGHAVGLAFSTDRGVKPIPRSLANIYRERESDLGIPPESHGDLSAWCEQGVLLLNRVLTVRTGEPGSHRGIGWEMFTESVIDLLVQRGGPLVSILWGNDARTLAGRLATTPRIESAHPSPLSAQRGFFGSRPFSRTNTLLEQQGADPIDWRSTLD